MVSYYILLRNIGLGFAYDKQKSRWQLIFVSYNKIIATLSKKNAYQKYSF